MIIYTGAQAHVNNTETKATAMKRPSSIVQSLLSELSNGNSEFLEKLGLQLRKANRENGEFLRELGLKLKKKEM